MLIHISQDAMNYIHCCLLLFLFHAPLLALAQVKSESSSLSQTAVAQQVQLYKLAAGINFQGSSREDQQTINRRLLEIGVYRMLSTDDLRHPDPVLAYGLSTEFELRRHPIIGFKASAWASVWFMGCGLNTIYYTDFTGGNLKIRPEIGIAGRPFKLTMGYNIPTFGNRSFERMRYADLQINLTVLLTLQKSALLRGS
ncbi:hypothetical protein [Hymenobacter sublimis]|uniref:DUF3575 domain-containing protein n=1 Tax=Hymenobacter sublimis TaxID=2933777 RepID=A0ABY4J4U3_9BACT|nr:hypothetical protein [Hymenobacter sublimis]UPL47856.1 hypothetical protein MWH26_11685 [Hymenobacter sublimis]